MSGRDPADDQLARELDAQDLEAQDLEAEARRDDGRDEVIGVAFRRSLAVMAALVALALVGWWLTGRTVETPAGPNLEAPSPRSVEADVAVPAVPFTDVTAASGIDFVHRTGAYGAKLLPETMGGGVAFFDREGDGDADLLFVGSSRWPERRGEDEEPSLGYFENDGAGGFTDRTAELGLDLSFYGQGVAVGDVEGDGDPDLFITTVGTDRLLRNDGDRFLDVTSEAGVGGGEDAWSTSAAFADIDRDGDLDLFVCHYVVWSPEIDLELDFRLDGIGRAYGPPQSYRGTQLTLFRNDGGVFTDITEESGVAVLSTTGEPMAKALAVLPTDADRDGLVDFLVANDTVRNFFYRNLGGGRFEEVGELYGLAYDRNGRATGAMGVDAARHRGDSLAFAVGNFANEMSSVYVAQDEEASFFVDEAIAEGLGAPSRRQLTFGLFFFDADLDGRQDLLQVNGHIEDRIAAVDSSQSFLQPAQLFWNAGDAGFRVVKESGDLSREIAGRGAAYADVDGDGDLDVAVAQSGAPGLLLRNDQALGHHWLRLELRGRGANTAALGARVELVAGGKTQRLEVRPTRSYLSQAEAALTFGLGSSSQVERLRILWPDGEETVQSGLAADRVYRIDQSDGMAEGNSNSR